MYQRKKSELTDTRKSPLPRFIFGTGKANVDGGRSLLCWTGPIFIESMVNIVAVEVPQIVFGEPNFVRISLQGRVRLEKKRSG